jgi:rhodanese-related sulfurtransferase
MKTLLFFIFSITGISLFAQTTLGTDTIRINVTVAQAKNIIDTTGVNPDFIILDIRTPTEYGNGHIADAININYYDTNFSTELDALDHNKMYLLHCQSGGRSTPTFALMQTKHFREIYHMNNGFGAWLTAGYPYVTGYTFTENAKGTNLTSLYPNPASNLLNVQFESALQGKLLILDLQGKLLKEETLLKGFQCVDISDFPSGMYIIKIESAEGVLNEKISIL